MNKKILTLTMSERQSSYEVGRLVEEANKMGIKVNRAMYRDLSFGLENGHSVVKIKGEVINPENTLGVWFRVAGTVSGKYVEGRNLMIRLLSKKLFCINCQTYANWPRMGKIAQHGVFIENDIPVVPTKIFYTKDQLRQSKFWEEFGWPIISKHERGYQGKSVRKFDNLAELEKFVEKVDEIDLGMYLWQKYLNTRWDLRIIVLNGKTIGAMKRIAKGKEFRSNFSLGGDVENWAISEEDKKIAEKVARVCGLDYCGVDIMKDEGGKSYVLEVNRQCQYMGFEKSTGINVAAEVVKMIKERGSLE